MAEVEVSIASADPENFQLHEDANLSVKMEITKNELDLMVKSLLQVDENNLPEKFAFLVNGQLLQSETLGQHIIQYQLSTESQLTILFFVDVSAPEPEMEYPHEDWVSSVSIHPDYIMSSTFSGIVHLWSRDSADEMDTEENTELTKDLTFAAHSSAVKSTAWLKSSSPTFLTTCADQSAIIWQVTDRKIKKAKNTSVRAKPLFKLKGHSESIDTCSVSEKLILTSGYDKMVKIWSADTEVVDEGIPEEKKGPGQKGVPRSPILTASGHSEAVTSSCLHVNHSDKAYTGSLDHSIRLWDIEVGQERAKIDTARAVLGLSQSSDQIIAAASTDRHLRLYDDRVGESGVKVGVKSTLSFHAGWISCVKFNPLNPLQVLTGSFDKLAVLWDIRSNKTPLYQLDAHKDRVLCLDWAKDGLLATGSVDQTLVTYKLSSMEKYKYKSS